MELTQLRQFKKIAENNSISLAAKELHISQPALSTVIKKLEDEFGLPLFEHSGNRIQINEAGRIALRYANSILRQSEQMREELAEYARKNSHLRLGFCDPGPMWYCVPQLSVIDNQLEFNCYEMPQEEEHLLWNEKYDIIVSSQRLLSPNIISRSFIKERQYLSVASNHPLAGETAISVRDPRVRALFLFVVHGAFDKKQEPFWTSIKEHTAVQITEDYFLFNQMLKKPDMVTTTTEIVKHYRNDGPDRVLIPLTDPELEIHYHISYLQAKEKRLEKIIFLLEQCAEGF